MQSDIRPNDAPSTSQSAQAAAGSASAANPDGSPGWLLPVLLLLVLGSILAVGSWRGRMPASGVGAPPGALRGPETSSQPADRNAPPISLVVDFANGTTWSLGDIAFRERMTVADLMRSAAQSRPAIQSVQVGAGASAMLTEIGGISNEGAAGRNWHFWVNDRHADRGCGVYELRPGDRVLWRFAGQE